MHVKKERKSKVYKSFIMSYVITLSIPLLIMTAIVFYNFLNVLKEQIEINLVNSFTKTVDHFEFQIQQLQKISLQLQLNSIFRDVDIRQKPYSVIDIRNELKKYSVSSFADRILIYHYDQNYILSADTIYPLNDFIDLYVAKSDNNFDILAFKNSSETEKVFFFSETDLVPRAEKTIMYLNKIPVNSLKDYATIIYIISESSLKKILDPAVVSNESYIFIKDLASNKIIFAFSDDKDNDKLNVIINELQKQDYQANKKIETNINEFSIFAIKLDNIDMEFIQVVPSNILESKVNNIRIIFFIAMVLIIVISGFAIILFIQINYKPIKKLKDNIVSSLFPKDAIKDNLDEIEALEYAFFHYNKKNEELEELAESYKEVFKQYLIDCFVMGQAKEIDNIITTCQKSNLNFDKKYYNVVVMRVSKTGYDDKIKYLEEVINPRYEHAGLRIYIKNDILLRKITIILGSDEQSEENYRKYIADVINAFKNQFDENIHIGMGDYVDDIFDLHLSYRQALMVLDYNYTVSDTHITNVSELSRLTQKDFKYPFDLFAELEKSLQSRDILKVEETIRELLLFIKTENLSLHWAKNICFETVNTIFKQILLFDRDSSLLRKPYFEKIYGTQITSYDDIADIMIEIIHDLVNYMKVGEESYDLELLQKISQYIKNNYMSPKFSLQNLADSIQMTPPYLSQYFKKKTNYTIFEYVTKLRMRMAKELLIKTDLNVSDIASKVGYYSTSSFIRKFRELEGITPGQYKKKYSK